MSVELKLTDAQAKWLQQHLDALLDDAYWGRGVLRGDGDEKEHAQTIHDKIKAWREAHEWPERGR
jgi:hypothetical protein